MKDDGNGTASDQLSELAHLLATGLLRLHQQRPRAGVQNPPDFAAGRLEVSPDAVLSVTNPVNGRESPKLGAPA